MALERRDLTRKYGEDDIYVLTELVCWCAFDEETALARRHFPCRMETLNSLHAKGLIVKVGLRSRAVFFARDEAVLLVAIWLARGFAFEPGDFDAERRSVVRWYYGARQIESALEQARRLGSG